MEYLLRQLKHFNSYEVTIKNLIRLLSTYEINNVTIQIEGPYKEIIVKNLPK